MAGWFRSTATYLGLVDEEYDDSPQPEPARRHDPRPDVRAEGRPAVAVPRLAPEPRPEVPVASFAATPAPEVARIVTLHPRSYNDARRIGEEYRDGIPVIMNLTEMDDFDAKRIVDFAAGLAFGLRGTIERVTSKVFLLSPANVDVGAAARAQLSHDGFFNQS